MSLFNKICGGSTGCTSPVCSWKAVYLLFTSTNNHISQIEQQNEQFIQYNISRNQALQDECDQALGQSERILKELASLKTIQGDSLMPAQEKIVMSMVKLKLGRSEAGLIQALYNVRGRPTNLIKVRSIEKGSAEASSSTIRQCSKFYECIEAKKYASVTTADVTKQSLTKTWYTLCTH